MNLLRRSRPVAVDQPRRLPAPVMRALLVDGRLQTIGELRSGYSSGARLVSRSQGIVTGDYSPEELGNAYKVGLTTFIGINVRCGIDAEIPVRCIDLNENPIGNSPAQCFIKNAPKLMWRLMAHYLIWGEIYIRKRYNRHGYPSDLEILSPLDVEPEINYSTGTVYRYRIQRLAGMEYVKPDEMIVDLTFNPFSDIDGTAPLEPAKVRSDIETNIGRYGATFFANSARPDLIINTEEDLSEDELKAAKDSYGASFKGVLNSFRAWFAAGRKYTVTPVSTNPVDLAMVDLTSQSDMKILAALRVNPLLAGIGTASDPLSAQGTYEQVRRQHVDFVAIPDVRQLCNMLNEQWLHKDFPDGAERWRLEPDVAALTADAMGTGDRVTTANTAVVGHVWSVNEGRKYTGKEPQKFAIDINPDWALQMYEKGLFKRRQALLAVGYTPETVTGPDGYIYELDPRFKGPSQQPPLQMSFNGYHPPEGPRQVTPPPAPAAIPAQVQPEPKRAAAANEACFVILSLANDTAITAIQAELRGKYPDIEWESPADFHITLVYAPQTNDLELVKQVLPRSINPFTFEVGPLATFDKPDKIPVILTVKPPIALIALQSGLAGAFKALGLKLSPYNEPDAWQPHVTLGYMAPDHEVPVLDRTVMVTSSTLVASVENGDGFETVYITRSKEAEFAQLGEIKSWATRVKKHGAGTRFNTEVLPPAIGVWIRTELNTGRDPGEVFALAKEWVRIGTFQEDQHPRDPSGKFGDKGGSTGAADKIGKEATKPADQKPAPAKKPKQPAIQPTPPDWATSKRPSMVDDDGYRDYGHMTDSFSHASSTGISQAQTKRFDADQKEALTNYTGVGLYKDVNDHYRGKSPNLSPEAAKTAKHLDNAIAQASLPESTVLYRGMHLSPEQMKHIKPGASLTDNGFSSTSFGQNVAQSYLDKEGSGGVLMRIKAPRGSHALAVETASDWPDEKEVILPRQSKLKITKVGKGPNGRMFVDAEYVQ